MKKKQEYKKEYNTARKRPYNIGVKLSAIEREQLEEACNKLGLNRIQFILKAVREALEEE